MPVAHPIVPFINDASDMIHSNIPDINCGGCGVFAREFALMLESVGATDYKIRAYGDSEWIDLSKTEAGITPRSRGYLSQWMAKGACFHHIVVEWGGFLWDSNGAIPVSEGSLYNDWAELQQGHISLASLKSLCNRASNWNSTFPREEIPYVVSIFRNKRRAAKKVMGNTCV